MTQSAATYILPEGWESETYSGRKDIIVLKRPGQGGGFVTLDFEKRIYAAGMGTPRRHEGAQKMYKGRGWNQEFVDDAVAWLNNVML